MPDPDPTADATSPLERARSIRSTADARQLYADWANTYDADVFDRMQVTGSSRIAELLAEHVPDRSTPVADIGCGTGAVGSRLASLGFVDVTGFDLSPEMLAVARRTEAYRGLVAADLGTVPTHGRCFGASVSAGTFVAGHLGADAVAGLLAMLRPGAVLAWSVAPSVWAAVEDALWSGHVTIRRAELELIRADGDDRAHLVVGVAHR